MRTVASLQAKIASLKSLKRDDNRIIREWSGR